jgi:tetratricopeptide (TPR) repeat protein
VDAIKEIDDETYADNDLGYNSADIHVVRQISQVAEGYLDDTESLQRTLGTFSNEFPELDVIKDQLNVYTSRTINENTYSEVAEEFLSDYEEIKRRVQRLRELKSFQEENLESLRQYRDFFDQLAHQTGKVEDQEQREEIEETVEKFHDANEKPVEKFPEIQNCFQEAKDLYHQAIRTEHEEMTDRYKQYREKLADVRDQAEEAGEEVNRSLIQEINRKRNDTDGFTCPELSLGGSVKCENCQNDLKTIRLALQNLSGVDEKLKKLERRIQSEDVDEEEGPETHVVQMRTDFSTVSELRSFLKEKIMQLDSLDPDQEVEVEI